MGRALKYRAEGGIYREIPNTKGLLGSMVI